MRYSYLLLLLFTACSTVSTVAEVREQRAPAAAVRGTMIRCDTSVNTLASYNIEKREFSGALLAQKTVHFGSYFEKFEHALEGYNFTLVNDDDDYSATIRHGDKKLSTTTFEKLPARLVMVDLEKKFYAELYCENE